jgi:hypothetical protein
VQSISAIAQSKNEQFMYVIQTLVTNENLLIPVVVHNTLIPRLLCRPGYEILLQGIEKCKFGENKTVYNFRENSKISCLTRPPYYSGIRLKVKFIAKPFLWICDVILEDGFVGERIILDISRWSMFDINKLISVDSEVTVYQPLINSSINWILCGHSHMVIEDLNIQREMHAIVGDTSNNSYCIKHQHSYNITEMITGRKPQITRNFCMQNTRNFLCMLEICTCLETSCASVQQQQQIIPLAFYTRHPAASPSSSSIKVPFILQGGFNKYGYFIDSTDSIPVRYKASKKSHTIFTKISDSDQIQISGTFYLKREPSQHTNILEILLPVTLPPSSRSIFMVTRMNFQLFEVTLLNLMSPNEIIKFDKIPPYLMYALEPMQTVSINDLKTELSIAYLAKDKIPLDSAIRAASSVIVSDNLHAIKKLNNSVLFVNSMKIQFEPVFVSDKIYQDLNLSKYYAKCQIIEIVIGDKYQNTISVYMPSTYFDSKYFHPNIPVDLFEVVVIQGKGQVAYLVLLPSGRISVSSEIGGEGWGGNSGNSRKSIDGVIKGNSEIIQMDTVLNILVIGRLKCVSCDSILHPLVACGCLFQSVPSPSQEDGNLKLHLELQIFGKKGNYIISSDSSHPSLLDIPIGLFLVKQCQLKIPGNLFKYLKSNYGGSMHIPVGNKEGVFPIPRVALEIDGDKEWNDDHGEYHQLISVKKLNNEEYCRFRLDRISE